MCWSRLILPLPLTSSPLLSFLLLCFCFQWDFFDKTADMLVNIIPFLKSTNINDVAGYLGNSSFIKSDNGPGAIVLSGRVVYDALLPVHLGPYTVTGVLLVQENVKFALMPGVELRFEKGASIMVSTLCHCMRLVACVPWWCVV